MKESVNIALLGKFLSGSCTDPEKESVQKWINESPENQAVFEEYKKVWNLSGMDNTQMVVDIDAGWKELNQRIRAVEALDKEIHFEKQQRNRQLMYVFMRVAAVIIVAFGLFYLFHNINDKRQNTPSLTYVASGISEQAFVLSDGSEIYLNKEAKITYPEKFNAQTREINFEGEAFFNVAHNPDKPFIIHCGEVEVEVLGTSFNLCSCPGENEIVLYLENGEVRFSSLDPANGSVREQIVLIPGYKAVYDKTTGIICRAEFKNQNYLAWKTGVLSFEKTPLPEVLDVLEETYDISIEIDRKYDELTLTARFDNESPESIFEVLHTVFGIDYTIEGQAVLLK